MTPRHAPLFALSLYFSVTAPVWCQTASSPNEGVEISHDVISGNHSYRWWAREDHYYYIQENDDLMDGSWVFFPYAVKGQDGIEGIDFSTTADMLFLRLAYTDDRNSPLVVTDRDGDGFSDLSELDMGTDPFDATDIDLNGIPDDIDALWASVPSAWKQAFVDDPNKAIYDPNNEINTTSKVLPGADYDGDGILNIVEHELGTNPLDYYNGVTPVLSRLRGDNQEVLPETITLTAYRVVVEDPSGAPLTNAPVVFNVSAGLGSLSDTLYVNQQGVSTLIYRTNRKGIIHEYDTPVYFKAPTTITASPEVSTVSALAGTASTDFTVNTVDTLSEGPAFPTELGFMEETDGSYTISWRSTAAGSPVSVVLEQFVDGEWVELVSEDYSNLVPADGTYYEISLPSTSNLTTNSNLRAVNYFSSGDPTVSAESNPTPPNYVVIDIGLTSEIGGDLAQGQLLRVANNGWVLTEKGRNTYYRLKIGGTPERLYDLDQSDWQPSTPSHFGVHAWEVPTFIPNFGCRDINGSGVVVGYGLRRFVAVDPQQAHRIDDTVGLIWGSDPSEPTEYYSNITRMLDQPIGDEIETYLRLTHIDDDMNTLGEKGYSGDQYHNLAIHGVKNLDTIVFSNSSDSQASTKHQHFDLKDGVHLYDKFVYDGGYVLDSSLIDGASIGNGYVVNDINELGLVLGFSDEDTALIYAGGTAFNINRYVPFRISDFESTQGVMAFGIDAISGNLCIGEQRKDSQTDELVAWSTPELFNWFAVSDVVTNGSAWSNIELWDMAPDGVLYATATNISDGLPHLVALVPITVEWESKYDDNPVEDFKVPAYYSEYTSKDLSWLEGKRYFSGGADSSATFNRTRINVKVSIPGFGGETINLKAFDVDDPTPGVWDPEGIIDSNDDDPQTAGNDNNLGWLPDIFAGKFVSTGTNAATAVLDANGEAVLEFTTSAHPGSNFRIAVTLQQQASELQNLQVSDSTQDYYVTADNESVNGFPGAISPMLTVWRKLHLEVDSMKASSTSLEDNFIIGNIIGYEQSPDNHEALRLNTQQVITVDKEQFEWGTLIGQNGSGVVRKVGDSFIEIWNPGNLFSGSEFLGQFSLYDDDEKHLAENGLPQLLPFQANSGLITEALKPKYAPAFIDPVDANTLGLNPNPLIEFELNRPAPFILGDPFLNKKDLEGTTYFWAFTVSFAYQASTNDDFDPNAEGGLMGYTPEDSNLLADTTRGYCAIFMEAIREQAVSAAAMSNRVFAPEIYFHPENIANRQELFYGWLYGTIAHEVGHPPESNGNDGDHEEGGLMQDGAAMIDTDFSGESIKRFRSAIKWDDT